MPEPDRPQRIHSRKMLDALIEAGIIRREDYVRRVVIDVQVGCAVILHVERFGDERLLNVARTLDGTEIEIREQVRA